MANDLNAQLNHDKLPDNWRKHSEWDDLIDWVDECFDSYADTTAWTTIIDGKIYDDPVDLGNIDPSVENILTNDMVAFLRQVDPNKITWYDGVWVGHDLWMTQNGHYGGFLNDAGLYTQSDATAFTRAAKTLKRQRGLWVDNDGSLHMS